MSTDTCRGAKERAHRQAQDRDLREYFDRGETIEIFVQTPPSENGGEEAIAAHSRGPVHDAVVFVDSGEYNLHRDCRVRCRIRYCNNDFLKPLALYRID